MGEDPHPSPHRASAGIHMDNSESGRCRSDSERLESDACRVLYFHHPASLQHDPRALSLDHPDSPLRLQAIENAIAASALPPLTRLAAPMASQSEMRLVHSKPHVESIRELCEA